MLKCQQNNVTIRAEFVTSALRPEPITCIKEVCVCHSLTGLISTYQVTPSILGEEKIPGNQGCFRDTHYIQ